MMSVHAINAVTRNSLDDKTAPPAAARTAQTLCSSGSVARQRLIARAPKYYKPNSSSHGSNSSWCNRGKNCDETVIIPVGGMCHPVVRHYRWTSSRRVGVRRLTPHTIIPLLVLLRAHRTQPTRISFES
ncbi:unnamed protein product, partial [Ectocarpus sp. 8 AP-2014]